MYKFPVQVHKQVIIGLDKPRWAQMMSGLKDGDYEILVRPKIEWDVEAMRNYFHGPALDFVREMLRKAKRIYSKKKIKEMLKEELGPFEHVMVGKGKIWDVKSTGDYTYEEYKKFLFDLNIWCVDCFGCELPPADEIGE
jgi:hypothetical protein